MSRHFADSSAWPPPATVEALGATGEQSPLLRLVCKLESTFRRLGQLARADVAARTKPLLYQGDERARCTARELRTFQDTGWIIRDAVHRIWAGERDEAALVAGIDPRSATVVRVVLHVALAHDPRVP